MGNKQGHMSSEKYCFVNISDKWPWPLIEKTLKVFDDRKILTLMFYD